MSPRASSGDGQWAGLWWPVAAGTLAGTPAFSPMDMSRRKEPQLFPGVWGWMAMVWVGPVPHPGAGMRTRAGAGSEVPFQLKAALLGVDARNVSDTVHSWEAAG